MKECNVKKNRATCICTYEPCERKGICCVCIQYHLRNKEVPGCFFSKEQEKTYDRSIENFIRTYKG